MRKKRKEYLARLAEAQKQSEELVAQHIADHRAIVQSQKDMDDDATFGQRAADAVARFGGSWGFIGVFTLVLLAWVALNSWFLLQNGRKPFDPYPYILLNLFLSMLASIQAPVILMSQNRQGEKDRINARNDYEVNLKAELDIMALHEKLDAFKAVQLEQTHLLAKLCATRELVYKDEADSQ
jgi:uncharacterized membrane protein